MTDVPSPGDGALDLSEFPAFVRDIDATLAVYSHYVLWGNVRDRYFVPTGSGQSTPHDLVGLLWRVLSGSDFELLVVFDPVDRVRVVPGTDDARATAERVFGQHLEPGDRSVLAQLRGVLEAAAASSARVAVVVDYASRLVVDAEHLEQEEFEFFRFCEKLSQNAASRLVEGAARPRLMNPVLWILDRDRDVPAWFTAGNQAVRLVPIGQPTISDRLQAADAIARSVPELAAMEVDRRQRFVQTFAGAANGLSTRAMLDVVKLANDRGIGFDQIDDAVRAYRVGMVENPWRDPELLERVRSGASSLDDRVLGQEAAVEASLDVLKRSVLGMMSGQNSNAASRPRGVLFFAGPTGVGKTELAKSLAELAFGDRNAYLRFDMSEFSAEHSDARLVGAPPGYTGFDAGGELTNGVRQQPFRLLLFDEVEKAHPRILDKFLQILDDGRLTDGRGSTVYFSETFIVFTSNLGIFVPDDSGAARRWVPNPTVRQGMPYGELQQALRSAIASHFTETLNRPELLNRIGIENVVVFDFIQPEIARGIFDLRIDEFLAVVQSEIGVEVDVDKIRDELGARCTQDRSLGGRGIENELRAQLVNPLSRALFALEPRPSQLSIVALGTDPARPEVVLG